MASIRNSIIYSICSIFLITKLIASDQIQKFDCRYYKSSDPVLLKVFEVVNTSDRVVTVHRDGKYSIGIFSLENGNRLLYKFSIDEILDFLKREKHKGLLTVSVSKGLLPEEEEQKEKYSKTLIESFSLNEYKRIVITSATGSGVEVLADIHH